LDTAATPPLKRRLAVMLYEAMLLFGVVFVTGWLANVVTHDTRVLQAVLFVIIGAYFIYPWSRSGQTLAMKTWRVRLVMPGCQRVPVVRALLRYLLAWMWFLPALYAAHAMHLERWNIALALAVGMTAWASTILLNKDRQFLHDQLLGTRLISCPQADAKPQSA
jgi:uncharacterized RDD family membrane protein YckC